MINPVKKCKIPSAVKNRCDRWINILYPIPNPIKLVMQSKYMNKPPIKQHKYFHHYERQIFKNLGYLK